MPFELSAESGQVLVVFTGYIVGVLALGALSHRFLKRGDFLKEYFVGNRGLGPWVLALTVAATAISGGTFMGFPSLIYTNGWIMALWISSYMVVPLMTIALFGKRINQVARISGAVTVPDIFRDRFASPALGVTATLLILIMLTFNLVAQFKGGALVMQQALQLPHEEVELFLVGTVKEGRGYVIGLVVFALTVVAYTTYGGFWAVTWNDVLQGMVMLVGVLIMAVLAMRAVEPTGEHTGLAAASERLRQIDPALVTGPGPKGYMPIALGFSFFLMWSLMSPGQPSGMVRLMSFKDAVSARRALLLICGYYFLTYVGILIIFVCARAMMPTEYLGETGSEGVPDSIMPAMARRLAHPYVAGLLLAAPYAAIMSTVAAFLLMISSSLVRDIYQRSINPDVSPRTIKVLTYTITALVGAVVMVGALRPPEFLQYIIVFAGSGQGCSFLLPMALTLYWRRATRQGVLAGVLAGFLGVFGLYVLGWLDPPGLPDWGVPRPSAFAPYYLFGFDPLVWGLLASVVAGVGVSLLTRPDEVLVRRYFSDQE